MSFQRIAIRTAALALAACVASPIVLQTQEPGTRVRVTTTARPSTWVAGRLALETPDSLAIITREAAEPVRDSRTTLNASAPTGSIAIQATQADTLWLARSEVRRFEVSQGRKSNAGKGALIGGSVVGAVGLISGIVLCSDPFSQCGGWEVPVMAAAGFVMGLLPGAAIGSLSHRERWEAAKVSPQVGVGRGGRVTLGLVVGF